MDLMARIGATQTRTFGQMGEFAPNGGIRTIEGGEQ
jgi:hypothetical protein